MIIYIYLNVYRNLECSRHDRWEVARGRTTRKNTHTKDKNKGNDNESVSMRNLAWTIVYGL